MDFFFCSNPFDVLHRKVLLGIHGVLVYPDGKAFSKTSDIDEKQ